MLIVDKNVDYYDYLSKVYGTDDKVVFDRRGSHPLVDNDFLTLVGYLRRKNYWNATPFWLCLEVGYTQYILELYDIDYTEAQDFPYIVPESVKFKIKIEREFNDNKHYFKTPLSIQRITFDRPSYKLIGWESDKKNKGKMDKYIQATPFTDLVVLPKEPNDTIPLLKGTHLTQLIDAQTIWSKLSDYISSLSNEKHIDTMTDIDKVISHGFHKKESFRGKSKP